MHVRSELNNKMLLFYIHNDEVWLPLNGRCRKPGPRFCVVPESFVIVCCDTLALVLTSGGLFPGKSL